MCDALTRTDCSVHLCSQTWPVSLNRVHAATHAASDDEQRNDRCERCWLAIVAANEHMHAIDLSSSLALFGSDSVSYFAHSVKCPCNCMSFGLPLVRYSSLSLPVHKCMHVPVLKACMTHSSKLHIQAMIGDDWVGWVALSGFWIHIGIRVYTIYSYYLIRVFIACLQGPNDDRQAKTGQRSSA